MFASIKPTAAEVAASLPGDDIVSHVDVVMDRAFTLSAEVAEVWPWIMQLGKQRAGWYFPRRLEWFIPAKRRGLRSIEPRFQKLKVGDVIPDWGGRDASFTATIIKPGEALVYESTRGHTHLSWAIIMQQDEAMTRLHFRLRLAPVRRKWLANSIGDFFDASTIAGLAAGLRERLN